VGGGSALRRKAKREGRNQAQQPLLPLTRTHVHPFKNPASKWAISLQQTVNTYDMVQFNPCVTADDEVENVAELKPLVSYGRRHKVRYHSMPALLHEPVLWSADLEMFYITVSTVADECHIYAHRRSGGNDAVAPEEEEHRVDTRQHHTPPCPHAIAVCWQTSSGPYRWVGRGGR